MIVIIVINSVHNNRVPESHYRPSLVNIRKHKQVIQKIIMLLLCQKHHMCQTHAVLIEFLKIQICVKAVQWTECSGSLGSEQMGSHCTHIPYSWLFSRYLNSTNASFLVFTILFSRMTNLKSSCDPMLSSQMPYNV